MGFATTRGTATFLNCRMRAHHTIESQYPLLSRVAIGAAHAECTPSIAPLTMVGRLASPRRRQVALWLRRPDGVSNPEFSQYLAVALLDRIGIAPY